MAGGGGMAVGSDGVCGVRSVRLIPDRSGLGNTVIFLCSLMSPRQPAAPCQGIRKGCAQANPAFQRPLKRLPGGGAWEAERTVAQ